MAVIARGTRQSDHFSGSPLAHTSGRPKGNGRPHPDVRAAVKVLRTFCKTLVIRSRGYHKIVISSNKDIETEVVAKVHELLKVLDTVNLGPKQGCRFRYEFYVNPKCE